MEHFQFSLMQRLVSRVIFYSTLIIGLSAVEHLVQAPLLSRAELDRQIGVATPYFGVPYEQVIHLIQKD